MRPAPSPRRQRGVATLLILLLLGLAVGVTTLTIAHSLRGTQQRQLAMHAATAAQGAAWRGVEVLRLFLEASSAGELEALGGQAVQVGGDLGIEAKILSVQTVVAGQRYRIDALITGEAGQDTALSKSLVEAVYEVAPGSDGSPGKPAVCSSKPSSPLIFDNSLNYTGGQFSVQNPSGNMQDIAVNGDLSISNASGVLVSGCAKGNITLSGVGAAKPNGHLYAEQDIRISGATLPEGVGLWGRSITLDASASGSRYAELKAGAFAANVVTNGQTVGTTQTGGKLLPASAGPLLPWTTGTVVPDPSGDLVITLSDGGQWLLDLSTVDIAGNGTISNVGAAERLAAGSASLPEKFTLQATGVPVDGAIRAAGLGTAGLVWGHLVRLGMGDYGPSGNFAATNVRVNGNAEFGTTATPLGTLTVGGNLWAAAGGRSGPGSYWNFPRANSGAIAGNVTYATPPMALPAGESAQAVGIPANAAGTTPGLPGLPFCDTRLPPVSADDYKAAANYVFAFVDGAPQLTIQNVKRADGQSLAGTYDLKAPTGSALQLLQSLLACNFGGNAGCLQNGQAWDMTGLTRMPPGVLWFDRDVTLSFGGAAGMAQLLDGVIAKGNVQLADSGGANLLRAPNFADPAQVCGGDAYPSNLCVNTGGNWAFATWTDADGGVHSGLPIGNVAIIAEGSLNATAWTLYGNILLGQELSTGGSLVTVHGTLSTGANGGGSSNVQGGGLQLIVPEEGDYQYNPVCTGGAGPSGPGTASAKVVWTRYR